jgi:prepilin-type N-terminal cleavage/methylation domain-containing protein
VAARARSRARRGLTLLELILVMGLLAIVLGAGLGAFASIDPGRRAAAGLVQNLLRTAHNTAVARRAPARVRIDPATGVIAVEALEVLGTWHFEDQDLRGGDGLDGVAVGTDDVWTEDGWLGAGLDLSRAPRGARVEVAVQDDPAFEPRLGFALELAVRPARLAAGRLVALGDAVLVETTTGGGVKASFRRRVEDEFGRTKVGGLVAAESGAGALRAGRWSRLAVQYDRRALRVRVDGVPVATTFSDDEVAPLADPLEIGGGSTGFPGAVDALTVAVVTGDEVSELPPTVHFAADAPRAIEFLAGGALDPFLHPEPVRIVLEFDDGGREVVLVGRYGTVE